MAKTLQIASWSTWLKCVGVPSTRFFIQRFLFRPKDKLFRCAEKPLWCGTIHQTIRHSFSDWIRFFRWVRGYAVKEHVQIYCYRSNRLPNLVMVWLVPNFVLYSACIAVLPNNLRSISRGWLVNIRSIKHLPVSHDVRHPCYTTVYVQSHRKFGDAIFLHAKSVFLLLQCGNFSRFCYMTVLAVCKICLLIPSEFTQNGRWYCVVLEMGPIHSLCSVLATGARCCYCHFISGGRKRWLFPVCVILLVLLAWKQKAGVPGNPWIPLQCPVN